MGSPEDAPSLGCPGHPPQLAGGHAASSPGTGPRQRLVFVLVPSPSHRDPSPRAPRNLRPPLFSRFRLVSETAASLFPVLLAQRSGPRSGEAAGGALRSLFGRVVGRAAAGVTVNPARRRGGAAARGAAGCWGCRGERGGSVAPRLLLGCPADSGTSLEHVLSGDAAVTGAPSAAPAHGGHPRMELSSAGTCG